MSIGAARTGCARLIAPICHSTNPAVLPLATSWRHYSTPTPSIQYAGPRTSRSFRRTRKEVEEQGSKGPRRPEVLGESSSADQLAVPEPYRSTVTHRRAVVETDSGLHRPVQIQNDPKGVLKETEGAMRLLSNSALVIVRQLEMMNVFMGFEQANRYVIMNVNGEHVGYLAEEEQGIMSTITRQVLRTHRPFKSVVMDAQGNPLFYIRRPFAFINSKIHVHAEESRLDEGEASKVIVGEAQQEWHPWRRRYNIFKNRDDTYKQFARIDSGLLAWTFMLQNGEGNVIGSIDRNFAGIARELFTDTGQYVVRFDAVQEEMGLPITAPSAPDARSVDQESPKEATDLTLDERAMALATAVTIDIDYFSRHSGSGMGFPMFFWGGGGGGGDLQAGEANGAGEAGEEPPKDSGWSDGALSDDVFEDPF